MPEVSLPSESELPNSVNTPAPGLEVDLDLEPDADSTNDNCVTANTATFTLPPTFAPPTNGESTNETEKILSRLQPKDSETDDRNGNLGFGSPTLPIQEDSLKFTGDTSELADANKTQAEDHSGDAGAGDKDPQANDEVKEINSFLPPTVTELTADNGVKVYLVGTAHFSKESQEDTIQTIQKVQPSLVVLELCHTRGKFLYMDEESFQKDAEDVTFENILVAFRRLGLSGIVYLILQSVSASITKQLGTAPGGEFRVALREAQTIPACDIVLGDREINITLSRAWSALSFRQILGLARFLLLILFKFKSVKITKEFVEGFKEKDLLEKFLSSISGQFPKIIRVWVDERDKFLSHSIWLAALRRRGRYNAQGEMKGPVVSIVGLGHVPGIVNNWGKVTEEEIAEIVRIPDRTFTSIVIGKTVKFSVYTLLAYGVYGLIVEPILAPVLCSYGIDIYF